MHWIAFDVACDWNFSYSQCVTRRHFKACRAAYSAVTQLVVSSGVQCVAKGQFGSNRLP